MKKLSAILVIGLVAFIGFAFAFYKNSDPKTEKVSSTVSSEVEESNNLSKDLKELNENFKFKGKYIHPRAIKDLSAWVADTEPGPVAVDVLGTYETNRYFGEYENRDGLIFIDLEQQYIEDTGWFGYRYLGRFTNGLHVIRTFDYGGGTGVFQEILLLEGLIDFEYDSDGKHIEKLILKRRGSYGIGDRYNGDIKLYPNENKITVGTDKRNEIDKEFVIQIK